MNLNKKTKMIIAGLGIYLISTGISFTVFAWPGEGLGLLRPTDQQVEQTEESELSASVFTGPKTGECPLNGVFYPEDQKKAWEEKRPLVVMIENHEDSRPQSGLSRADLVYEAVAEGGITRFVAVFYCQATEPATRKYELGPVRSARTYFLDWASEYSDYPLYVHVGGAGLCNDPTVDNRAKALCQIDRYGWKDADHHSDMDQFALSYHSCRREPDRTGEKRATEHTMYCDSKDLWEVAIDRDLAAKGESGDQWDEDFIAWSFKEEEKADKRGDVSSIAFDFWEGYKAYAVSWQYDQASNRYLRSNGGVPHKDFLTDEQLAAKVVVIQFAQETGPVDEHKHMLYKTIGTGKALVFQDGQAIEARWSKKTRVSRTIFTDVRGQEIKFNRGQMWIEVLPTGNQVSYDESGKSA
ncbi:MAG: DUF3048 domain-containing protein [Patescibacteria group bacterium]